MIKILLLSFLYASIAVSNTFIETFESGDMSTTNSNGFSWGNLNRTSIVTQHPQDGNVVIFNGTGIYNIVNDGRDWTAHSGENSLRFRYPAGVPQSEQRFGLGVDAYHGIWIKFWLRVPTNYNFGAVGGPNKFFALWSDGYSANGDGSTFWLGMNKSGADTTSLSFSYSPGGFQASGGFQQPQPFINIKDRGRWMEFVMHVKPETADDASDGIVETFMRWEDETIYTKLHESFNAAIKIPTNGIPNGFQNGYILGWANASYSQNTEWLLDDFEVSDVSLLGNFPVGDLLFFNGFE